MSAAPRFVVGVDGSPDGLRAAAYATRSALLVDGSVHLVHAVDDAVMAGAWGIVQDAGAMEQVGEQALDQARAHCLELGLDAARLTSDCVLGNATQVLARNSENASRLVVGRRRLRGLERMFVGSTSASLVSLSHCPVVVISAAVTPHETGGRGVVAVGVDGQGHSDATLREAILEARIRRSPLLVTHVQPPVPVGMFGGYQLTADAERELMEQTRATITTMVNRVAGENPEVEIKVVIDTGDPVDRLVDLSREVDLLVLGMRAPSLLGFALGGVSRAVLAHAESPLLVVR